MIILGIHDYKMPIYTWLSEKTSNSFVRCFESLIGDERHAILYEPNYECTLDRKINGVTYHFCKTDVFLYSIINKIKPDIILYNYWRMNLLETHLSYIKVVFPSCKNIIRFHHDIRRILVEPLRTSILSKTDEYIVADEIMIDNSIKGGYIIPFGINMDFYKPVGEVEKIYDFVCSANENKTKNLPLVNKVISILESKGYKCKNVLGATKEIYRNILQSSKIYFTFTLSEGGTSRSLLEALTAGCNAVCAAECDTLRNLPIKLIRTGAYIRDGILFNEGNLEEIVDQMIDALNNIKPIVLSRQYDESVEIRDLMDVIWIVYCTDYQHEKMDVDQIFKFFNFPEKYKYGFSEKMEFDSNFDMFSNIKWIQDDLNK